jgi:ribosomal protein S6
MAYRIRHQPDADYHLLQFTAPPTLIETLSHDLRITDGVVRFRVIKNLPGTPAAPESPPPVVATAAPAASGTESPAEP